VVNDDLQAGRAAVRRSAAEVRSRQRPGV